MAFDKEEVKQLEDLFVKSEKRSEKKTFEIVCQSLEEVVFPQFQEMKKEMQYGFKNLETKLTVEIENTKYDIHSHVKFEVDKIKKEIEEVKMELKHFKKMANEDVELAVVENDKLTKKVEKLEERVKILELAHR